MKKIILAMLLSSVAAGAQANIITSSLTAPENGVGYFGFGFSGGDLSIRTSTAVPNDPQLFLFFGSVSLANYRATNDDGFQLPNIRDSILNYNGVAGNYVLAMCRYNCTLVAALTGINLNFGGNPAMTASLSVSSSRGTVTSVPEPGTLALLGFGLLGLGLTRRKA